ncbi:MAG: hypothetical protein FWE74_05680 [Oscillospiraceae bacterium]|nr:hypothetical protein [Oscillospiraceae bacterium]
MAERKVRTIAFQVDDQDFIAEYEARVKESGLSVKNYFVSLIKADIAQHQTQTAETPSRQSETAHETEKVIKTPLYDVEIVRVSAPKATEPEAAVPPSAEIEPEPVSEQEQAAPPPVQESMMNLFVKVTIDQREALEANKIENGETVGNVLNRLINGFLENMRNDNLSDEFDETFKYYSDNVKSCDTTVSAKIPVRNNQELAEYLNEVSGSRNALVASLVHMELNGQEMSQEQGMSM